MLKHYDDDIDSILKMNPGNYRPQLFGGQMDREDQARRPPKQEDGPQAKIKLMTELANQAKK